MEKVHTKPACRLKFIAPVHLTLLSAEFAEESLEAAKEKAQKAKEVAQDPERAKQAAHETARQTAQKTIGAKETVKAKAQETAPGLTLASTNAPCELHVIHDLLPALQTGIQWLTACQAGTRALRCTSSFWTF